MATKVLVLGAGPGGYVAAIRAAQGGAEVTVVEQEHVGGTCLNWGCIPSKTLITTAEMIEDFHRAAEFGIQVEGRVTLDLKRIMARKDSVLEGMRKGIHRLLQKQKVRYLPGRGIIKGPGLAAVRPVDGKEMDVAWDRLILATGTRILEIPSLPFDGVRVLSSDHALCFEEIPESVVIVGGGVIGCEFAFILRGLGAGVTVVEAMDRVLPIPSVDEDCSKTLQREMAKKKIKVIVNRTVGSFEEKDGKLLVAIGPSPFLKRPTEKDKKPIILKTEKILVTIGRKPNTDGIGLDKIALETNAKGWISADEGLRTTADNVYAIGDILGPEKIMLAHVASTEGAVAAANALGGDESMDYTAVPGGIFTSPEIGVAGLTEKQARERGYNVRGDTVLFRTLGKAQAMGKIAGQAKIVSDAETGKVLGVHIIGPHATDLIAEGTLAIKLGATVQDMAETIHAHPTLGEIMLEAAFKASNQSLHG